MIDPGLRFPIGYGAVSSSSSPSPAFLGSSCLGLTDLPPFPRRTSLPLGVLPPGDPRSFLFPRFFVSSGASELRGPPALRGGFEKV